MSNPFDPVVFDTAVFDTGDDAFDTEARKALSRFYEQPFKHRKRRAAR